MSTPLTMPKTPTMITAVLATSSAPFFSGPTMK